MKKLLYSVMVLSLGFFLASCDETTTDPDPVAGTGNIVLTSTPSGAQIWQGVAATNTGKVTPDTLKNVAAGTVTITLKLTDYIDTTFTVTVESGKTVTKAVTLTQVPPMVVTNYTNIQLYQRSSANFSGLDLSTGTRVNSTSADADIYYDDIEIKSQHLRPGTTPRITDFYNGMTGTALDDGVDAPAYSSTGGNWVYLKAITQNNYSFLYTGDLYFVKLVITERGGATGPSDPDKWIKVSYRYNETKYDRRF